MRSEFELKQILQSLIASWENEVAEFKQADATFKTSEIGRYFSALLNEANLRGLDSAWLVFGVDNEKRKVVGSSYKPKHEHLMAVKNDVRNGLETSLTFRDIHEIILPEGRVILFEIPPAPAGIPVGWHGHRYARAGESLSALGVDKEDAIRAQSSAMEWSAAPVPDAGMADLDPAAVERAIRIFCKKHEPQFSESEVKSWPIEVFLQRIGLLINGKLIRFTILLLGREESANLLNPHPAQITWKLDADK